MPINEINKLKQLSFTKQLTFAYLTCERLFPNYLYFSNNFDFGNPHILKEAMYLIYRSIFENEIEKIQIDFLIKKVERNTPDTEDFVTSFVSCALDACSTINDTLEFLGTKDFSKIENVSTYATDTVNMYIQENENLDYNTNKNFQQIIDSHPLMLKEISVQKGIITYLEKIEILLPIDIDTLCQLQENNKGSLGLY